MEEELISFLDAANLSHLKDNFIGKYLSTEKEITVKYHYRALFHSLVYRCNITLLIAHKLSYDIEQGVTLEVLVMANDHELALLTTKVVDKIKLRAALEKIPKSQITASLSKEVKILERQSTLLFIPNNQSLTENNINNISFSVLSGGVTENDDINKSLPILSGHKDHEGPGGSNTTSIQDWNLQLDKELEILDFQAFEKDKGKNLRRLLSSLTIGKLLLEKADKSEKLNSRDRAFIVKLIVETELRKLQDISTTIRKNIWQDWAREVVTLFKGEASEVYYVPYHVVGGKVIQASGLFHNRLITQRRVLVTSEKKKRKSSTSSESNSSCSEKSTYKRIRPLPETFNTDNISESTSSPEDCLDWLRGSSSPQELVKAKWIATFQLRNNKLSEGLSIKEYFCWFPALSLPDGHELLSLDFETVYPDANKVFEEKFPTVKIKILELLAEKGSSSRPDQTTLDLLDLATTGEHQASLAAFMGIVSFLRQVPTVAVPRKKLWRLSKERDAFVAAKGIPSQPYILAVGTSWATVSHYEIVIYNGLRYQLPDICSAIKKIYQIYWALDVAYPKNSAICWMFIQRAMFNMKSKYDTEGVPLRELLHSLDV